MGYLENRLLYLLMGRIKARGSEGVKSSLERNVLISKLLALFGMKILMNVT